MPAPDAMSCEQLARLVGTPKAPTILDVRREAVRAGDPRLLPGARALAEAEERRKAVRALDLPPELGGRDGPEPVRYGDWEKKGLAVDF